MSQLQLRINGRGNAWPVFLGQEHPFYNRQRYEDLANTSCSLFKKRNTKKDEIEWELLIDAGHGTVQYLLQNHNRIPEAIFITHPHIDHFLGIDWIIQSYSKTYQKPYPVYATILTWKKILTAFPHLETLVNFNELTPYSSVSVNEVSDIQVTAYPVYHGQNAEGAAMFLFENDNKKILFTGDLLCPLLKATDFANLENVDLLVTDANNRFPYPQSNHWSITTKIDENKSSFLKDYINKHSVGLLLSPHLKPYTPIYYSNCFDYFLNQEFTIQYFIFDSLSFVEQIQPKQVVFLHYSGNEDKKYYQESILNSCELQAWIKNIIRNHSVETTVTVPYVGQCFDI
ncbi:MAG: phosphoribosyl 1,2-cyclic phosphate phosphodiesterase [Bacteroidales bacterium]|nr:phosphoribosyl 1,2-cyclic phosphate phosphodiesterase [Bacteroidales bacterium]